jgi:hypothetical protein
MARRLALLIATYEYRDPGLRHLRAPEHDAQALADVLADPAVAGFHVSVLLNRPHWQVGEAISAFYRDRRRDDLTLLYFTGHGLKDDNGRLYLAMSNTLRDSLLFTGLSTEQIDEAMAGCVSRQKILILDCCYSGAYPAGQLTKGDDDVHTLERFQGRSRTVLTASDSTQYSFEGDRPQGEPPRSVFTQHLVAGLRDGSADLDGDGLITMDELYSYVHDRVVAEMPQQRPKRLDNVEGRTVIATNVNWTLPSYLRNAIDSPIAKDRLGVLDGLAHLYRIGSDTARETVCGELQHLAEDDSKQVSAAAVARLGELESPAEKSSAAEVPPAAPDPPAAEPAPSAAEPLPAGPVVNEAPEPAARPRNRRRRDLAVAVAVTLAVLGAVLPSQFTRLFSPDSLVPSSPGSRPASTSPSQAPARTVSSILKLVPSTINKDCTRLTDTLLQCDKGPPSHTLSVRYEIHPDRKALAKSLADKRETYESLDGPLRAGDCSTGTGHYGTFREGTRSWAYLCDRPDKDSGYTEMFWTDSELLASAHAGYYTETGDYNFDWHELARQWKGLRLNHS